MVYVAYKVVFSLFSDDIIGRLSTTRLHRRLVVHLLSLGPGLPPAPFVRLCPSIAGAASVLQRRLERVRVRPSTFLLYPRCRTWGILLHQIPRTDPADMVRISVRPTNPSATLIGFARTLLDRLTTRAPLTTLPSMAKTTFTEETPVSSLEVLEGGLALAFDDLAPLQIWVPSSLPIGRRQPATTRLARRKKMTLVSFRRETPVRVRVSILHRRSPGLVSPARLPVRR